MASMKSSTPKKIENRQVRLFEEDKPVICTKSESVGYTKGKTYIPYKNDKGWLCLKGDDGFEDPVSLLVSSFKKG